MQYKSDFFAGIASVFVLNAVNLSLIGILVYNFNTPGNWNMWDLMFLYSFWMLSRGIYGVYFRHLSDLEEMIVNGTFDAYLILPASPFLQFIGKDISYTGVGDFLVGLLDFILASARILLFFGTSSFFIWGINTKL